MTAPPKRHALCANIVNIYVSGEWRTYEKTNGQPATFRSRECAEVLRDTLQHNGIRAVLSILEITL